MTRSKKLVAAAVMAGAGLVAAATTAFAGTGSEDAPLTGDTRQKAVSAALAHTGGEITDTEAGDDGATYGVEVRRADGSQVEVNLDGNFTVIGAEADEDSPGETE